MKINLNSTTMPIIKWEPFAEIDRLFEDFPAFSKSGWDLAVDVYEKDKNVVAEMNLPGINSDKIDVSVEDGYLRISGSREESKEETRKQYYSKEIRRGLFERIVHLPSAVQKDKASAEYKNSELRITSPKSGETKAGRIKVKTV